MKTLKCSCGYCGYEYQITYDDVNQIDPEFCPGCGSDDQIDIQETKENFKSNSIEFETYRKCVRGEIENI